MTYLWNSGATTRSITASSAGNYSVTVTNASNCSGTSATTIVTVYDLPATPTITASGVTNFCSGGSVTLTSSEAFSYLWSNGETKRSISVTTGGNYSVTISNGNKCSATSSTTFVTVYDLPATPTISTSGVTEFCSGGSVTLTSTEAVAYLWSNGETTRSISVTTGGNYSVKAGNIKGCFSISSAAITVTVNALPIVSMTGFKPICITYSPFILTGGLPAGGTYSGTGVSGGKFNPSKAGIGKFIITYSFTNSSGCANQAQQSITVTNCNIDCKANITASCTTTFCSGGSVVLSASEGASYLWSPGGQTTKSITVTTSGNYHVRVTDANKCVATSPTTKVTVNPLPPIPVITASGPTTFCMGDKVILTSSASTGNRWNTGSTSRSITVTESGSYAVTVKNISGCKSTSATTKVIVSNCSNTYCEARGYSGEMGYIRNVFVCHGFNKTSCWNGYSDYSGLSVNTASGKTLGIAVTPGYLSNFNMPKVYTRIWIDWNADGDFTDEGEMVCNQGPSNTKLKLLIKVPNTVVTGKIRMRIALRHDAPPAPCGTFNFGEVEDYSINIIAARGSVQDASPEDFIDDAGPVFTMYPNPANNRVVVEREGYSTVKAAESPAKLIVVDASGRIIAQQKMYKLVEGIDVSKLANGIYLISITTTEGTSTQKIVIQH